MRPFERLFPWMVGNAVILGLFARDLAAQHGGSIAGSAFWGRDFVNLWAAGRLVLSGRLDTLYDVPAYQAHLQALFGPLGAHNYSYPPLALPLAVPFALLPYGVALAAWLGLTGWLFVRAAAPWWRRTGLPGWTVLLTPAGLVNLWAGQYGFLLGALLLFGWGQLERRPALAGLCFGLLAVKPHLAMLVPLALLLRRDWIAIAAAAATVGVLVGGSLVLFGWARWHEYLTVTAGVQAAMIDGGGGFFRWMSTSAATAVAQAGGTAGWAALAQAVMAMAGVAMVVAARRAAVRDLALLTATATFLVLPYAFNYDLTVVAVGAGLAMADPRLRRWQQRVAALGLMAPQLGLLLAAEGWPVMPLLLLALAAVQFRAYRTANSPTPRSGRASSRNPRPARSSEAVGPGGIASQAST